MRGRGISPSRRPAARARFVVQSKLLCHVIEKPDHDGPSPGVEPRGRVESLRLKLVMRSPGSAAASYAAIGSPHIGQAPVSDASTKQSGHMTPSRSTLLASLGSTGT